jgi:hypothetical protein
LLGLTGRGEYKSQSQKYCTLVRALVQLKPGGISLWKFQYGQTFAKTLIVAGFLINLRMQKNSKFLKHRSGKVLYCCELRKVLSFIK